VTPVDKVTTVDHIVTADVQELDTSGAPLIGKKTSGAKFHLYDETLASEIKEALTAAEVGGIYHAEIKSHHGDHAHQTRLAMTVTKIEKVELPPLDEPLIRKLTGDKLSSVDEFRQNLRTDLSRYWEEQANTRLRDAIADEIVRSHEFPVPESLVNGFLDSFLEEVKKKSPGSNLPRDFNEKKFREENRAYAIWQAKWMLLQERIAEVEHITITDEDLQGLAEQDAPRMGIGQDRLLQYYKNSGTVRERILSDKITAFLRQHAVITERVIEPTAVQTR
jgi:trigger factor